ncbi:hypothetical protein LEN26_019222 [Aphanomyces euteiches]|nr:hypothetical protein LEN26_019222 [Aphanomyces euteiches]KAH9186111.1 hypothetical protein AeNC1_011918 [Aphanomyces euteiches]
MGRIETTPLHSTKHGELRVFKLKNISRPEIWAHASLVAPGLHVLECSSKEALQFYCHLCDDCFPHDATRLQNLHRHMKSKHLAEIQQASQRTATNADNGTLKRKAPTPTTLSESIDDPKRQYFRAQRFGDSNPVLPLANHNGAVHVTVFHSRKHGPISLFKVKHINRPEIWMYVSLVAPQDVQSPPAGWTSRDATHFYCHLCDDCFPHDYVRSQNLHRHVKNKHRSDVESYMKKLLKTTDKMKSSQEAAAAKQALPSLPPVDPKQTKQCEVLLAEWLATSLRPLDLVDDILFRQFIAAVAKTNGQFTLPSRAHVEAQVDELYLAQRRAVAAALADKCSSFSLSSQVVVLADAPYLAWTLHYLTPSFDWIHVTLAHDALPLHERPSVDWLSRSLTNLLHDWNLPMHQLALVVSDMDLRELPVRSLGCLGRLFDAVLAIFLGDPSPSTRPEDRPTESKRGAMYRLDPLHFMDMSRQSTDMSMAIRRLVQRLAGLSEYFDANLPARRSLDRFLHHASTHPFPFPPPVECPRHWQSLYQLLHGWHHQRAAFQAYVASSSTDSRVQDLSDVEWGLLEGFLVLLEPSLQLASMIFAPTKPSAPILFSVLKLFVQDVGSSAFFHARGLTPLVPEAAVHLDACRATLHAIFAKFMEDQAASLLWTSSLHPSVAATLAHCTPDEKHQVKQRLLAECPAPKSGLKYMQQALGDMPRGPDAATQLDQELQTYFGTVAGGMEDPLQWWRANHAVFPRLAILARKWLSAWPTSEFESPSPRPAVPTTPLSAEMIHRMAFLRATPTITAAPTTTASTSDMFIV